MNVGSYALFLDRLSDGAISVKLHAIRLLSTWSCETMSCSDSSDSIKDTRKQRKIRTLLRTYKRLFADYDHDQQNVHLASAGTLRLSLL